MTVALTAFVCAVQGKEASLVDEWKSKKASTEQLMQLLQTYKDLGDNKAEVRTRGTKASEASSRVTGRNAVHPCCPCHAWLIDLDVLVSMVWSGPTPGRALPRGLSVGVLDECFFAERSLCPSSRSPC